MAMTRDSARNLGTGPSDATGKPSDQPTQPPLPAVRPSDELMEPIVVPNTLWTSADPLAYEGGRPTDITHLREFEASGAGRRDDARWSGVLEVIPTKADYVLDLMKRHNMNFSAAAREAGIDRRYLRELFLKYRSHGR